MRFGELKDEQGGVPLDIQTADTATNEYSLCRDYMKAVERVTEGIVSEFGGYGYEPQQCSV